MIGIILPEVIIFNFLEKIIKVLRNDLTNATDEKQTILYKILGVDQDGNALKMNAYVFFKQAKTIIQNVGNLSVHFGYDQKVAQTLSLHILLPSEEGKIGIGGDEGYITEDILDSDGNKTGTQNFFTQEWNTTYQIMITSNNSSEVNLAYNILKSMFLICFSQLEIYGLRLPKFSGNDIVMQDTLIPVPIFHKVMNISFMYEQNVPQLLVEQIMKSIHFEGTMLDYNE